MENNMDCPEGTFACPEGNLSLVTLHVYNIRWVHNIHCLFTGICEGRSG